MNFLRFSFVFCLFAVVFISPDTYALNGARLLGNSTRDEAMGGATTASPGDTSAIVKNPAGLVKVGNRFDVGLGLFLPRVTMQPKGALANNGINQKSDAHYCPIGNIAVSFGDDDTAFGIGFFSLAGVAAEFEDSRITTSLVGDYDRRIELKHMRIAPAAARQLNDKLSVGAALNFGISMFRTDLPVASAGYIENRGSYNWETAFGLGYTLGILYDLTRELRFGLSFESETWMSDFKRYDQVFKRMDIAPVASAGLAYDINPRLEITYDFRYIFWTRSKITGNIPTAGGFGWRDQRVHAIGLEFEATDDLILRAGYNYGRSPIHKDRVFANALAPLIAEHHLSLGLSKKIDEEWTADITWVHAFNNSMTDNGLGDAYSASGNGTSIEVEGDIIAVGMSHDF